MSLPRVSRQSAKIYRLLSKSKVLSARQIADELNIFPNAVYRAAKPLAEFGMIEQLDGYPVRYKAVPANSAMNWYLRAAAQSFRREFGSLVSKPTNDSLPTITFIKDREHMLKICEHEARKATSHINYIVSGHRIPDSTVLSYRKASTVGVKVRAIIQNTPDTTDNSLERYHKMGVEVRYLPNIGIRLFIFDGRVAVLTSYDDMKSSRAFGIRFTHVSVASQLDHLFEQRWLEAKPIK
jgi:sugar-specific transcriptional regulator TrmB